jgi:hypothetical protein
VQVVRAESTCFELASALTTCTWGQFQHKSPKQGGCELITSARREKGPMLLVFSFLKRLRDAIFPRGAMTKMKLGYADPANPWRAP